HANYAPRRALDHAQSRGVAARIAAHGFHAEHVAHVLELEDLVIEAAHTRFFQFHATQFFASIVADAANDVDHPAALGKAHGRNLLLGFAGSVHGFVHGRESPILRRGAIAGDRRGLHLHSQSRHNLARNIRNQLFLSLHHGFSNAAPSTSTESTIPTITAST